MPVLISGYAMTTLGLFILSNLFVVGPASIPTPHPIPRISLNFITAPILAIAVLWATRCLDHTVIRNGIVGTEGVKPYNILTLFFSLAYMATSLDITGIFEATAFWVSDRVDDNGWKLHLYFYAMLTLLSILLGRDHVILLGTAFLVYYTKVAKLDPRTWVMAEFAAANTASMVLFTGNPTNVVICEGFGVNNAAFTAYTILPFIACNVFCLAALAFQYRGQVPRKLVCVAYCDPQSALLDPVGACVGSFMLGTTLVLCLAANFFGVDVWMISLPFAFGKLSFDLGWDCYRSCHGVPIGLPQVAEEEIHRGSVDMGQGHMEDSPETETKMPYIFWGYPSCMNDLRTLLNQRFPTFVTTLPRLPFAFVPFAFSQFILVEALSHQGWVKTFAGWLVQACHNQLYPTIWLIGVLGVILCNISGTNIGATILLTKVVREAALPQDANRGAAIALAVASNIGAVSFTSSASLTGLVWQSILDQKKVQVSQTGFALWNLLPLLVMMGVGLGVVSAEMAVLFPSRS